MSALSGMHIDNVKIYIDGPEVPIMDGSSKPFVELIESVKINDQNCKRKIIKVLKEVEVCSKDSFARLSPNKQFAVNIEIEFDITLEFDEIFKILSNQTILEVVEDKLNENRK